MRRALLALLVIGLLAVLAGLVAACGGDGESSQGGDSGRDAAATAAGGADNGSGGGDGGGGDGGGGDGGGSSAAPGQGSSQGSAGAAGEAPRSSGGGTTSEALRCLQDERGLKVYRGAGGTLRVGDFLTGPRIVFETTPGQAESREFQGEAEGAESIGNALVYVNRGSDETLEAIEDCLSD